MGGFMYEAHQLGQAQVPTISIQLLRWGRLRQDNTDQLAQFIMYGGRVPVGCNDGPMLSEHTVKTNGLEFNVFATFDPRSNGTWVWTNNYPHKQLVHDTYSTSSTPAHRFLGLIRDVFLPAEIATHDRSSRSGQWASEVRQVILTMIDDDQGSQLTIHIDRTEKDVAFAVHNSLENVIHAIKEVAKLCN